MNGILHRAEVQRGANGMYMGVACHHLNSLGEGGVHERGY